MSTTIDNRVVDLDFDNKDFETNVSQSLTTLDKLKKGLELSDAAKGLANLEAAGKKFNLNSIAESVGSMSSKFSAFGVIGFTVLQNLTNAAIEFGQKLFRYFLLPMQQGFSEYETQIGSIQTILANTSSKGTTLDDVSAALNELNAYADQTIYNFTEMTRNIGTFTAAGVDLETSVAAIKGIANLAAVSGSTSQQAATAMYQLSQALSSGTVKLMDWNSVVNAGMGGQVFQDALKETARNMGISIDEMIEKHGSFRETLQEGWLSSDVLLQTLKKFTGDLSEEQLLTLGYSEEQIAAILKLGQTANDAATKVKTFSQLKDTLQEAIQSGWTQSWQLIIGDFEQAKAFFTEVSDTLNVLVANGAEARNKILREWNELGGRETVINTLRYAFQALLSIVEPIREALKTVFPKEFTGKDLAYITMKIAAFTKSLILSGENADRVKRIFTGIFSVLAIAKDIVINLATAIFGLFSNIPITGSGILEFFARIGDYLTNLRGSIDVSEGFRIALEKIRTTVETVKASVSAFVDIVRTKFSEAFEWFQNLFGQVDTSGLDEFFDKITFRIEPLTLLAKGAALLIGGLFKFSQNIAPYLFEVTFALWEFITNLGSAIIDGLSGVDYIGAFDTLNTGLIGALLLALKKFFDSGTKALSTIPELLGGIGSALEAWQENLKSKTLLNIAFALGILAISLIALAFIPSEKLTFALGGITALVLNLVGALAAFGHLGTTGFLNSIALGALAASILTLAIALKVLSTIDAAGLNRGVAAIYGLTAALLLFSQLMSQNGSSLLTGALGLLAFSASLGVLVLVVKSLGALKPETLTNGLIGVGVLLAEVAAFMLLVDNASIGIESGIGFIGIVAGILLLTIAIEKLGKIRVDVLEQGLLAVGAVLVAFAGFSNLTSGTDLLVSSAGILIIAGAMILLTQSLTQLGSLPIENIQKGLLAMSGALIAIALAMNLMPPNMIVTAAGLAIAAGALLLMAMALERMSDMSWDEIGRGLATLAGALGILALGLYAMTGTLAGSAALLVAAAGLVVLAPALSTLGRIPINELGMALLALAGVFTVLGLAGLILTPVVPTILALGAAMLLIGVGAALVGAGLLAFSAGLAALAVSGAAGAVALVAIRSTILGLLVVIAQVLIDTLIVLAEGIVAAVPVIGEAIKTIVLKILEILIEAIPPLQETIKLLLLAMIDIIGTVAPEFNATIISVLLSLLQDIAAAVPDFVQAGFDILIGFLTGIRDNIAEVVTVVGEIIVAFLEALALTIPDIIQAGFDLVVSVIQGIADAIEDPTNKENLLTAATALIRSLVDGLISGVGTLGQEFIAAVVQMAKDAIAAMFAALRSDSPSKYGIEAGRSIPQGLIIGVKQLASNVTSAVKKMGSNAIHGLNTTLANIASSLNTDFDMSPHIRPVVDLTDVYAGNDAVSRLFGQKHSLAIAPALSTAGRISGDMSRQEFRDLHSPIRPSDPPQGITFNQYNTSPKELSRLDIYRQTRLQLKAAEGVIRR